MNELANVCVLEYIDMDNRYLCRLENQVCYRQDTEREREKELNWTFPWRQQNQHIYDATANHI